MEQVNVGRGNVSVEVTDTKTGYVSTYSMSTRLKKNLDVKIIPDLKQRDKDCVLIVDGKEGSGKSTLAMQIGKYVDPSLTLSRVVFSPEDFRDAILNAKKGQCIIFDEAFTGFSSRASLSPINRVLVSLAMQMRQKNLMIIIVLPTIFLLDKYIAMFRARALIHVFESKGRRGYFKVFNDEKKKLLLLLGAKTMTYKHKLLKTRFKGRFYGKFALGDENVEKLYRKKKEHALESSEKTSMTSAQVKFREQRDLLIYLLRRNIKITYQELANLLADYDLEMSFQQIAKICARFGDKSDENKTKSTENQENKEDIEPAVEIPDEINENIDETADFDEELPENDNLGEDMDDL